MKARRVALVLLLLMITVAVVWAVDRRVYSASSPGPEKVTTIRVYMPAHGDVGLAWTTASGGFSVTLPEWRAFFIAEQFAAKRIVWTETVSGVTRFYVDFR